jgi:hypothetical protein
LSSRAKHISKTALHTDLIAGVTHGGFPPVI